MSAVVLATLQHCLQARKKALVYVCLEDVGRHVSLLSEILIPRYQKIVAALHAKGVSVFPHNPDHPNSSIDGYQDPPHGNLFYPATRPFEAKEAAKDEAGTKETKAKPDGSGATPDEENPDWHAIMNTISARLREANMPKVEFHSRNFGVWCDLRKDPPNYFRCEDILCSEVERLNSLAAFPKLALRHYFHGYVIELANLIGTGRCIANHLDDLAKHEGKESNAYCKEDVGCVILIAANTSTLMQRDRDFLEKLTDGRGHIGYTYQVTSTRQESTGIPKNVDGILRGQFDVLSLLEGLVEQIPTSDKGA